MDQAVLNVITQLEARDRQERALGLPGSQRIQALHPDSARLLYITALAAKATAIMEVGTNRGYSTLWLALAAKKNGGKVTTCELDPAKAKEARAYFEQAGLAQAIEVCVGDAGEILRQQTGPIDLLFIDAVKEDYKTYLETAYSRITPGGLIVADNVLSHSEQLLDYTTYVQNHPRLESATINIGRGLEITVKTGG